MVATLAIGPPVDDKDFQVGQGMGLMAVGVAEFVIGGAGLTATGEGAAVGVPVLVLSTPIAIEAAVDTTAGILLMASAGDMAGGGGDSKVPKAGLSDKEAARDVPS